MRRLVRTFREAALAGFRSCGGAEWLARTTWRRRRLLILCYHGVSLRDEHEWNSNLFVTPSFLRRRFEILRSLDCHVLPLGEAVRRLGDGSLPERSVVLTFDDGMHNFSAAAVPVLEELKYPATVYLSTYYCVNQRPILGLAVRYLLWRAANGRVPPRINLRSGRSINVGDSRSRDASARELIELGDRLDHDRSAQTEWLESLAAELGVDWRQITASRILNLMSPSEVTDVARRGFSVQLHTHRHSAPCDEQLFRSELLENRRIVEDLTGQTAVHFCYPSGRWSGPMLPWLRELGVETGTTCDPALAAPSDNTLLLPRFIDTMGQSEVLFESWIVGSAALVSGRGH